MWRARYQDDQLVEKVDKLWDEVQPLYDELHKYVRYQLRDLYGDKMDKKSEFIPAHLLGNMWVSSARRASLMQRCKKKIKSAGTKLGKSLRPHQTLQERVAR